MKRNMIITAIAAAAMVLALGLSAQAQPKGKGAGAGKGAAPGKGPKLDKPGKGMWHKGFGHGGGILEGIADSVDELSLTADQKKKIKEIRTACRDKVAELKGQKHEIVQAMVTELKKKKPDMNKLAAKHEEMKAIKNTIMDLRFAMVLDVYNVLTDKQKTKLWEILDAKAPCKGDPANCPKGKGQGDCPFAKGKSK